MWGGGGDLEILLPSTSVEAARRGRSWGVHCHYDGGMAGA